jgi:hypothetical protein
VQLALNVLFVLMCFGFISLVLNELSVSQKHSEVVPDISFMQLSLDLKNSNGIGMQRVTHVADSLQEMQEFLNAFALFRVHRAGVWQEGKMTHVMNTLGILEAV